MAGVEGNGQNKLIEVGSGMLKPTAARLSSRQKITWRRNVRERKGGMSLYPEDRLKMAA